MPIEQAHPAFDAELSSVKQVGPKIQPVLWNTEFQVDHFVNLARIHSTDALLLGFVNFKVQADLDTSATKVSKFMGQGSARKRRLSSF